MTKHTPYKLQQLVGESHTTDNISITAADYIHYQATKHENRQTDPLDAIPEHIKNNP